MRARRLVLEFLGRGLGGFGMWYSDRNGKVNSRQELLFYPECLVCK